MTGLAPVGRTCFVARASTRDIRSRIQRVAACITERDQLICVDLKEHRVLHHRRLSRLYAMGIVWRNRPRAQLGSLPWHYTLDGIGAQIVAEHLGLELKAVGYREDRKRTLVDNPRLGYTRAVNGFFTRMHYIARTTDKTARIVEWRGEAWWRPTLASAGSPRRVCADRRCQSVPRVRPRARPRNVEPRSALFFAFVYNALVFPIAAGVLYAATGLLLSPMIAAAAMAMSSPSVVTNANRLRGYRATGLPAEGETTDRVNVEVHEYEDGRRKRR